MNWIVTVGLWVEWWTGVVNTTWYNWWSGFGSDLSEWVSFGAALGFAYKHLQCHQDHPYNCHRPAFRHLVDPDTHEQIRLCRKHHPRKKVTAEHVADVAARIEARRQPGDPTVGS